MLSFEPLLRRACVHKPGLAAPLDALAAFVAATTVGLPAAAFLVVNN